MCYLTFSFSLNIGFFKNKCKKKNKDICKEVYNESVNNTLDYCITILPEYNSENKIKKDTVPESKELIETNCEPFNTYYKIGDQLRKSDKCEKKCDENIV